MTINVAVFGAGSTGCYIGGLLKLAGCQVTLICREGIKTQIEQAKGITLTDYEGQQALVMPDALITQLNDESFDLVLITLKCHQLKSIELKLCKLAERGAKLVFMQNGLGSLETLSTQLPPSQTLQGITPFNVLNKGQATFHRGTEGHLMFQHCAETALVKEALHTIGVECELYDDMKPVIYGKLLLNLNNAINAITDLPLKQQLETLAYRKVLAACMREWLKVCQAAGVEVMQFTALPPRWVPTVLRLPNFLFKPLAQKMLAIDPEARSSMWEDIQAGRKTEVEFLNGAVVSLGERFDIPTPVNQNIVRLIHTLEEGHEIDSKRLLELA